MNLQMVLFLYVHTTFPRLLLSIPMRSKHHLSTGCGEHHTFLWPNYCIVAHVASTKPWVDLSSRLSAPCLRFSIHGDDPLPAQPSSLHTCCFPLTPPWALAWLMLACLIHPSDRSAAILSVLIGWLGLN